MIARIGDQEVEELKIGDITRFLRRRKYWLLAGAILGLLAGAYLTMRAPRLFTSTTTVELNKDSSSGLGIQDLSGIGSQLGGGSSEFMTDMMTHQAVLLNPNTALAVISDLGLMQKHPYVDIPEGKQHDAYVRERSLPLDDAPLTRDRALGIFQGGLRVDIVKNTRLMMVSYTDTDPDRATKIANAVIQAYSRQHTQARYDATLKASEWLGQQLEGLKRRVEENHKKVSAFQQSAGVIASQAPPAAAGKSGTGASTVYGSQDANSTAVQRLLALNAELSRAEIARIGSEAVYRLTQTKDPSAVLDIAGTSLASSQGNDVIAANGKNVQILDGMRSQIIALKVQLAAEQVKLGDNYPSVRELRSEIATLQSQMQGELTRINGEAKSAYLLAKANEEAIRKSVEEQQQTVFSLGNNLSSLAFLQQEENTSRGLYQDLYTRLEEAGVAAGVKSTDMVVVDPARLPSRYSSPRLRNNLGVGLGAGLFVGLLIGLFFHLRDTALHSPEDFQSAWGTGVMLGIVPSFKQASRDRMKGKSPGETSVLAEVRANSAWVAIAPKSKTAEVYRQIRTSILFSRIDTPPRVIMFTSALSGDGKSTTACNMASVFAVQADRVLLIDADMRRPTIREKVGCTGVIGLSDVLARDLPLQQALQQHPLIPNMQVLTAGTIPPNPAELLGSQRFSRLIDQVRSEYDYVLIDAPPTFLVADPLLIAPATDGIVVVMREGRTTRQAVRALILALSKPKVHLLGYIINDLNSKSQQYGYGYGYGDGSGYYEESPGGKDEDSV